MTTNVTNSPNRKYLAIPDAVVTSIDYRNLSGTAVKLLNALISQFDSRNNGDFTATWTVMHRQHGFRSQEPLARAIKELLAANLIIRTREGRGAKCALYAVTWLPITPPKKPSLAQILGQANCPSLQKPVRKKLSLQQLMEQAK